MVEIFEIEVSENYIDPGATASDDVDGDISYNIIVDNGVDSTFPGTYLVTYSVTDAAGNFATGNRTVSVVPVPENIATTTPEIIPELTEDISTTTPKATASRSS